MTTGTVTRGATTVGRTAPARPDGAGTAVPLLRSAVEVCREGDGPSAAAWLQAQLAATAEAPAGRIVVAGEAGVGTSRVIGHWLDDPAAVAVLADAPAQPRLYRFAEAVSVVVHTTDGDLRWTPDLGPARLAHAVATDSVQRVTVRLPHPLLRCALLVEPPPLHEPDRPARQLLDLTPVGALVLVVDGYLPMAAPEMRFLQAATAVTSRVAVVAATGDRLPADLAADLDDAVRPGVLHPAGPLLDQLLLARNAVADLLSRTSGPLRPVATASTAVAEARVAHALEASSGSIGRVAYELSRVRADAAEFLAAAVRRLEQNYDRLLAAASPEWLGELPSAVRADVQELEWQYREGVVRHVESVAATLLAGAADGVPATMRVSHPQLSAAGPTVVDPRNEAFAALGNFSSGRQSISLLGSLVAGIAMPVTIAGAAIGVGFLHLGRESRRAATARLDAQKWLRAQLADVQRELRYASDLYLAEAQLTLTAAMRRHAETQLLQARAALEDARTAAADAARQQSEQGQRRGAARDRALATLDGIDDLLRRIAAASPHQ
jgi:hypothetical protein